MTMPSVFERLKHMKRLGFRPKTIFDCGAFDGRWAKNVAAIFPGSQLVLFEPNKHMEEQLMENTRAIIPQPVLYPSAVADGPGKATLKLWSDPNRDSGASLLEHVRGDPVEMLEVATVSIDQVCAEIGAQPDLLKLDLQGGELPALKGADRTLSETEAVVVEFGCIEAYRRRTRPKDLFNFLSQRGFRLYDIVDCYYRPYDGALCGGDSVFVKSTSPLRRYQGWE